MPKIDEQAKGILGEIFDDLTERDVFSYGRDGNYVRELPSEVIGSTKGYIGERARSALTRKWSLDTLALGPLLDQRMLADIGKSVGFPVGGIVSGAIKILDNQDPYGFFMDIARDKGVSASGGSWGIEYFIKSNGPIAKSMNEAFGGAFDSIGNVIGIAGDMAPIVGAVTEAVFKVIGFIRDIVMMNDKSPDDYLMGYEPAVVIPGVDKALTDHYIIDRLRSAPDGFGGTSPLDLEGVFSPPGAADINGDIWWEFTKVIDGNGDKLGYRLSPQEKSRPQLALGSVPGMSGIDMGWEIGKREVEGGPKGGISITRSIGETVPSSKQLAPKIWSQLMKPGSPLMFSVSAHRIRERWLEYIFQLRKYIETVEPKTVEGKIKIPVSWKKDFCRVGKAYYGWNLYNESQDLRGQSAESLIKHWGIINQIQRNTIWEEIDRLEKSQFAMIDTITCAYVHPKSQALIGSGSTELRNRHRANRQKLLTHHERCKVDVSMIPDKEYRDAMIAAKKGCSSMLSAGMPMMSLVPNAAEPSGPSDGIPGVREMSLVMGPATSKSKKSGGSGAVLAIGAAAVLLAAMKGK